MGNPWLDIPLADYEGHMSLPSIDQARMIADINAAYLETAGERHACRLHGLKLHCAEVQADTPQFDPVEFIYAALIFEYVDTAAALATLRRLCLPGGWLAALMQLPGPDQQAVSASPYGSLSVLSPLLQLVEPAALRRAAAAAGFAAEDSRTIELRSGKCFELQVFRAEPASMEAAGAAC